jgi:hypothetical protein
MEIVEGDLWSFYDQGYYVVVPTNRATRRDGAAIMGRGVAQQAVQRFPKLPQWYGAELRSGTYFKIFHEQRLVMFPVKNDWREQADLELIKSSCIALRAEALRTGFRAALPLVGCGFGELSEEQVIPLLETHLPRPCFTLVRRGSGVRERYPHSFAPGARRDAS